MAKEIVMGNVYGRLTVISNPFKIGARRGLVQCRCACGREKVVATADLRREHIRSCGCLRDELLSARMLKKWTGGGKPIKHNRYKTPEYRVWASMKARCSNPKATHQAIGCG